MEKKGKLRLAIPVSFYHLDHIRTMQRRNFIKNSAQATARRSLSTLHRPLWARVLSPADKVIVGVMGINSRGLEHIKEFAKIPNVKIAYSCDVEDGALAKGVNLVEKLTVKKPWPFFTYMINKSLSTLFHIQTIRYN